MKFAFLSSSVGFYHYPNYKSCLNIQNCVPNVNIPFISFLWAQLEREKKVSPCKPRMSLFSGLRVFALPPLPPPPPKDTRYLSVKMRGNRGQMNFMNFQLYELYELSTFNSPLDSRLKIAG